MPDRQQPDVARRGGAQRPEPHRGRSTDLPLTDPPATSDDFRVPRAWLRSVPTGTVMLSASVLGSALSRGSLPASSPAVWPLVVLAVAGMGYDLGLRALRQRQRS